MNIAQALKTLAELKTVADVLQPQNGDLRWELLQQWLKNNPKYEKQLLHCLTLTPDQAVKYLAQQFDLEATTLSVLDSGGVIRGKVEEAIRQLQTLYKERSAQTIKQLPEAL